MKKAIETPLQKENRQVADFLKAGWKILEKIALLLVGGAALTVSILDPRFETLRSGIQICGGFCVLLGLVPMVWEYIKATLPTKSK